MRNGIGTHSVQCGEEKMLLTTAWDSVKQELLSSCVDAEPEA